MYIPKHFHMKDEDILSFIKEYPFGILISQSPDGIKATHIPFLLKQTNDSFVLIGHIAEENQHAKFLNQGEHLIILNGSHAYISSSWYKNTNVSTWNYEAVHLYGTIRILNEVELVNALTDLTNTYESHQENPRTMDKIPDKMVKAYIREIVGFEFQPTKIEAKSKLSQNRNKEDYHSIVNHLEKQNDFLAHQVAEQMKKKGLK
ncbi:MAG: FMN-binding negative transcriptional regulator [Bacteroidia bacterium]|nr:FMN-binding negative transcriptional regulator [Bacteroidia bacterium]